VTVSLINPIDPVGADQTAGYHYNFATTAAGLATVEAGLPTSGQATTYATASATNSYAFTATTIPTQTFYAEIINANGLSSDYSITVTVESTAMIIDDSYGAAGGWTTTGTWTNWTGQGYDNDVHQATPVTSTNPAGDGHVDVQRSEPEPVLRGGNDLDEEHEPGHQRPVHDQRRGGDSAGYGQPATVAGGSERRQRDLAGAGPVRSDLGYAEGDPVQ
jgi:hypothetical protein